MAPGAPPRPSASRRALLVDRALAVAVWLATVTALFWPVVRDALRGIPRYFEWDVPEQYWPDLVRLCTTLDAGTGIPYWSPHDRGGYPYYADPQAAPYHPVNWAICAVAGPSPSIHWATARALLGFFATTAGAHVWLRRTTVGRGRGEPPLSHAAAALGACVLGSAPFLRHNWELNLTFAIAWLPWMLAALDALLERPDTRRAALLALAVGLCAWSGSPPALWLSCTLCLAYASARLVARAHAGGARALAPLLGPGLVAAALSASLCAVVVVPGLLLSARSVQSDHTFASIAAESLSADRLLALVSPQPGNHLFLGPVVWLGAGAALASRRTRLAALASLALSSIAVLLAMGEHGPLFRLAFDHVPGFATFRLPHRYEAWLGPCGALLAALGLDTALRRIETARPSLSPAALRWVLGIGLVALHLGLVTAQLDEERHTRAGVLPCRGPDDPVRALIASSSDRVFDEFALGCRSGTRLGHRDLRGYQDPLMLHAYERLLSRLAEHPGLLRQLGVRYALVSPHFLHGWDHHYLPPPAELEDLPGAQVIFRDGERAVIDLGEPVPRAYLVPEGAIVRVASREEALATIARAAPSAIAVLEAGAMDDRDPPSEPTAAGEPSTTAPNVPTVAVRDESADVVSLSLPTPHEAGVVVLGDTYDVGWTAVVDGAPARVLRVNGLLRGVRVAAGARVVTLHHAPLDGRATRWLWALALVLTWWWIVAPGRSRQTGAHD
jgi:hypothetical protein